jgi:hypothetical protein
VTIPQAAFERGLVLDDATILQLQSEGEGEIASQSLESLRWPDEPLRAVLISEWPCACARVN